MIGLLNPWQLLVEFGIPLIIIVFIGFVLVVVIRTSTTRAAWRQQRGATELARIDKRLTSIVKILRDISNCLGRALARRTAGGRTAPVRRGPGPAPRLSAHD